MKSLFIASTVLLAVSALACDGHAKKDPGPSDSLVLQDASSSTSKTQAKVQRKHEKKSVTPVAVQTKATPSTAATR